MERYRPDIQGLRAVAVVLVLLSHAGVGFLPGGFVGVDMFFVISGFLITGLLVGELARTGRISLRDFYARRARRLLPAAAVVLAATLLLTVAFLPRTRWSDTGGDVVASGLFAMNWRLAVRSVDYLHAGAAPSMLQHYWSLAVEEQFYLLWPALLILAAWLSVRAPRRRLLALALAVVAVPSFAWSVHLTRTDPAPAYFVTTTRLWELALGGGLALAVPRLPRLAAAVLGWAGLAAILAAACWITPADDFPGYAALVPTLGTAAVIAAGSAGRWGPERVLGLAPVVAVGAVSYSLYLWHWPLLVVAQARFGPLGTMAGLAAVAASVPLAVLTYHLVENPIRGAARFTVKPNLALRLGAASMVVTVVAGLAFPLTVRRTVDQSSVDTAVGVPGPPGAAVLGAEPRGSAAGVAVDRVDRISPDPLDVDNDRPDTYSDGCFSDGYEETVRTCVYGDPGSVYTVALAGDSHAGNWIPALQVIAAERKWRLVTYLKAGCPFLDMEIGLPGCTPWYRSVHAALTGPQRPALLLTSNMFYTPMRNGRQMTGPAVHVATVAAMVRTWSTMVDAGVPTVVIRDTPALTMRVAECVSLHPVTLTACTTPRATAFALSAGSAQLEALASVPTLRLVDLTDAVCPDDPCAPVIGNVLIFSDSNHLTATYTRTLTPRLRIQLHEILS